MKPRLFYRIFVYFVSASFFLMMNSFPRMIAEAKEVSLPIGEMVSKGEVKFEARENVWKKVETSHFPIFKGTRVKTESGHAILTLPDNGRIEVNPRSLFSFDKEGRLILTEGSIKFHLPITSEVNFKIGNLSIIKARTLQAAKGNSISSPAESLVTGSLSIHPNGSITVKTLEGKLNVLNQDHVLLAAVSKNDSVTIPSVTVSGPSKVMVAQAGETATTTTEKKDDFLGISTWGWVGIIGAAAAVIVIIAAAGGGGGDHDRAPICP